MSDTGEQTPVNDLDLAQKSSVDQNNEFDQPQHQTQYHDMPRKSGTEYIGVAILCLLIAFGGFVFGWDTGTISGFVNMSDFRQRFGSTHADGTTYFTNARVGLIVSIFNIGCAIGGIILSKVGDVYGRKMGLTVVMVIYIVGIVIQIASINKWYQYFIGRIISGLGVGGVSVISPMFISEISPKYIRGTLVSCYQLMITLGIFLGYCTTFGTKRYTNSVQWRVPLGLSFAWALLMIAGMTFLPESPRFLIEKGRFEEAKKAIARVNKLSADDPSVAGEVEMLEAGIEQESSAGKATWGELFTGKPKIFYRVQMGVMLQSLQQLTGDNYFFYYGTTVFQAVGMNDSFETSIVIGVVNFFSTFVGIFVMEQWGRRQVLKWGAAGQVACFVVFASVGVTRLYPNGYDGATSPGAGNCMIVFTSFYIFCFATSWAPGVFVVVSESYPLRIKSKAMALAQGANWLWGFLISFFTPFITDSIHFYYGYVFMGCLVFAFFYVHFIVYETKGLRLEDVDLLYLSDYKPWNSSKWVPPTDEENYANYSGAETPVQKPEDEHHDQYSEA